MLLALLDIMPMSGYDIKQNLQISLDSLWSASYGQIYPMLHKLQRQGLITSRNAPVGLRDRIVYELTDSGRQAFEEWLLEPVDYLPTRDPFRFWVSYMDRIPAEEVRAGVARHIARQQERRQHYLHIIAGIESGDHPMIQGRSSYMGPDELSRLRATRAMIFRELLAKADFEIASAERILEFHENQEALRGDSSS